MPPHIPIEVVDIIIGNVSSDMQDNLDIGCQARQALASCTFVSRSFSDLSRQHLFSRLYIKVLPPREEYYLRLLEILNEDPQFCSYIDTLEIDLSEIRLKEWNSGDVKKALLTPILYMLSNKKYGGKGIRTFKMYSNDSQFPWWALDEEELFHFLHANTDGAQLRKLRSFSLSNIDDVPMLVVTNLPSSLKELTIHNGFGTRIAADFVSNFDDDLDAHVSVTPSYLLNSFKFADSGQPGLSRLISQLCNAGCLSNLKNLEIAIALDKPLGDILNAVSSSLESLKLWRGYSFSTWDNMNLDLRQLVSLRGITIVDHAELKGNLGETALYPPIFPSLFSLFDPPTRTTSSLESVQLHVRYNAYGGNYVFAFCSPEQQWEKLDRNLASERYPNLRRVDITAEARFRNLDALDERRDIKERICQSLKSYLPLLHADSSPVIVNLDVKFCDRYDLFEETGWKDPTARSAQVTEKSGYYPEARRAIKTEQWHQERWN